MKNHLILFLFISVLWTYADETVHPKAAKVLVDDKMTLPISAQNQKPWVLPDALKDPEGKLTRSIELLFKSGMCDPRGLPYHHVKVREHGKLVLARGWVLPDGQKQRFALGWSGLIYPVAEVGELADLEADIVILNKMGRFTKEPFDNYQEESFDDIRAKFVGAPRMMHPFAAPYLLLRLGYPINLSPLTVHPSQKENGVDLPWKWRMPDEDNEMLAEFALMHRDDGVEAWIEGNFHLASERLKLFDSIWHEAELLSPKVENEDEDPFAPGPQMLPNLNGSWREILLDARRRLSPAPEVGESEIEQAIASWDQIDKWSETNQPASFRLVASAGPLAIKPLLDCLQHDKRWTRVVNQEDEENYREPRMLRVRDLAIAALESALEFTFEKMPYDSIPNEPVWYDEVATKLQELCKRYEYQWGAELWFRILQDPKSDLGYQLDAVDAIVIPSHKHLGYPNYINSEGFGEIFYEASLIDKPSDVLRDRANPSVLDLIKVVWQRDRRITDKELLKGEINNAMAIFPGGFTTSRRESTHHLVHCMEVWSPGNVEVLRSHYQWLLQGITKPLAKENRLNYFLVRMCDETLARRYCVDDEDALADIYDYISITASHSELPLLAINEVPASPELDKLIAEAFLGKEAPMNLVQRPWEAIDSRNDSIAWDSPLLKLPSFRKALIEALESTAVQATLKLTPEKRELLFHAKPNDLPEMLYRDVALSAARKITQNVEVRACDLIAYYMTPGVGYHYWNSDVLEDLAWLAPKFYLDDPVELRNKAIADWITRLKSYPKAK